MSTVKADNFTWKSGQSGGLTGTSVTGPQIVYGVAKAWCNYNGAATTIRASFNTSSVTRNSTGDYTNNFASAFVDGNFSAVGTVADGGGVRYSFASTVPSAFSTTTYRFVGYGDDGSIREQSYATTSFFR